MDSYLTVIFLLVLLALLSAFFSGSETALFSLTKSDLHRYLSSTSNTKRSLSNLMMEPQKILITILIGNLLVNLLFSALSTDLMLIKWPQYGHFVSIVIVTPLMIIFCEISPKILSINHYEHVSSGVYYLLKGFHRIFAPLRLILQFLTNGIIKIFNLELQHDTITRDELHTVLEAGELEGIIEKEEGDYIKNVLRFSKKNGSNIMFPRNRSIFIQYGSTIEDAMKIFLESEITRAPVFQGDPDNIVGMVDSKELLLSYLGYRRTKNINRFIRPVDFFPSSIELNDLLNEFLSKGIQIAVMVDEYGGTDGVVTLNSILAELMGKDFSKWDIDSQPDIRMLGDDISVISGEMQIDDFNFHFDENLKSSETDSIGGYIIERLACFPHRGDEIETEKYRLRVRFIRKNKVETVEVIQLKKEK
jgi:putative hemolysin